MILKKSYLAKSARVSKRSDIGKKSTNARRLNNYVSSLIYPMTNSVNVVPLIFFLHFLCEVFGFFERKNFQFYKFMHHYLLPIHVRQFM